jgi:excisionase family DNA binding protein
LLLVRLSFPSSGLIQASERVRSGKVCAVMRQPSITGDGVSQRFPFASAVPIASFATILTFVPDDAGGEASAEGVQNASRTMNDESTSAEPGGVTPLGSNLQAGKFLTVAEVAAILRLSKMSVYRLIHSGQLEAVQFGRSFRVTEKALNTYLDNAYFSAG